MTTPFAPRPLTSAPSIFDSTGREYQSTRSYGSFMVYESADGREVAVGMLDFGGGIHKVAQVICTEGDVQIKGSPIFATIGEALDWQAAR